MTIATDERFARFDQIGWWDRGRVARAKVVVVGAGALGNEIVKNLALLGVGRVVIVDFDTIERSNLSRSVLFREKDEGRRKSVVAAEAASAIYTGLAACALSANVVHDVGLGLFRWADVVIGALDNREARLAINRYCYLVGVPWVDGAIEVLAGVARVFAPPEGPCYECTMTATDWRLLDERRSCSLLNRRVVEAGHVPTTPTIAAIVAGIQCQEALKLLHGLPSLAGSGFVVDGLAHQSYVVEYPRNPECQSHVGVIPIQARARGVADTTAGEILVWAREALGEARTGATTVELAREQASGLECPGCGDLEPVFASLSTLDEERGVCPHCGERRAPVLFHGWNEASPHLGRTLAELGVPPWDVLTVRRGEERVAFELAGDARSVVGALWDAEAAPVAAASCS